jgi:hypothetical protein
MTTTLTAADLFVLLEREYRKRARECDTCFFTLPFRVDPTGPGEANWSVVPSTGCENNNCRLILEELVSRHQAQYRLAGDGPMDRRGSVRSRPH